MVTYRSKYDMKPAWWNRWKTCLWHLKCTVSRRKKQSIIWQDILTAYGIDVSAEEIRTTETETLKTTVREKVEVR